MLSLLSRQRKILLGVTVAAFFISATLVMKTYFTMQLFNAADACRGIDCDSAASSGLPPPCGPR